MAPESVYRRIFKCHLPPTTALVRRLQPPFGRALDHIPRWVARPCQRGASRSLIAALQTALLPTLIFNIFAQYA